RADFLIIVANLGPPSDPLERAKIASPPNKGPAPPLPGGAPATDPTALTHHVFDLDALPTLAITVVEVENVGGTKLNEMWLKDGKPIHIRHQVAGGGPTYVVPAGAVNTMHLARREVKEKWRPFLSVGKQLELKLQDAKAPAAQLEAAA